MSDRREKVRQAVGDFLENNAAPPIMRSPDAIRCAWRRFVDFSNAARLADFLAIASPAMVRARAHAIRRHGFDVPAWGKPLEETQFPFPGFGLEPPQEAARRNLRRAGLILEPEQVQAPQAPQEAPAWTL